VPPSLHGYALVIVAVLRTGWWGIETASEMGVGEAWGGVDRHVRWSIVGMCGERRR
jgi:hypothetical protein